MLALSLRPARLCLMLLALGAPVSAQAISTAPLEVINAYIEGNRQCAESLTDWNSKYARRVIAGELPRTFYYRTLGYLDWGNCGKPYLRRIFGELQKIWLIYEQGQIDAARLEAKEQELTNLLFAALKNLSRGEALVDRYEQHIAARLLILKLERYYDNCTLFGEQPLCLQ